MKGAIMEGIYLYKEKVEEIKDMIDELGASLWHRRYEEKAIKLEKESYAEDLWQDIDKAQKIMRETKILKDQIGEFEDLRNKIEDLEVLIELSIEEEDYNVYKEIKEDFGKISKEAEDFKLSTLLSGEYDKNNAILSIHSGAGGLEAQDWAEDAP